MLPRIQWRSLRTRIITWSFVPTMIILVAVAVVILYAYRDVTEELVIERNQQLTRLAASQFATELKKYTEILDAEARTLAFYGNDPAAQRYTLERASNRLVVFDGGAVVLDTFGTVVATEPERPEILEQSWSDRAYYRQMLESETSVSAGQVFSDVVADGPGRAKVIIVAVPITSPLGEFEGAIAGMFRVSAATASAFYGDVVRLRLGESGSAYLVDGQGQVIYHSDPGHIGQDFSAQQVVQQVLSGEVDAVPSRDLDGREIVASYAPVPGTSWGLVNEEDWATLVRAGRGYQGSLLLLLTLGMIVPALVVAVGVRQITRPITELAYAAQEVARGRFNQTIATRTGDEIEELAAQFNLMAAQLQESYASLERRVADRTKELAALNAIAAVVSQSLALEEVLNDALDKTLQVMQIEAGGIYLLDEAAGVLSVAAHRGLGSEFVAGIDELRVDEGFYGRVVQSGEPLVVRDLSTDTRFTRTAVREEGLHSLVSVPLSSKGKVLGALFAVTYGYRQFTEQDVQLLTSIGHQIGVAVENAGLYEQAQQELTERRRAERELRELNQEHARRNRELTLLNRVIAATTSEMESEAILETVCQELALAFGVPQTGIALLDNTQATPPDSLTVVAECRVEGRPSALRATIPIKDNPSTRYVLEHKEPLAVADAQHDPRLAPIHDLMRKRGVVSLLILPLVVHGEVVGTVGLDVLEPHEFTDDEIQLAMNIAAAAAQALDRAWTAQQLRESEARYRSVSELTSDYIYSITITPGGDFQIDWHTDALWDFVGYSPDELAARGGWTALVHPDDLETYQQRRHRDLTSGMAEVSEYRIVTKSDEVRWLRDYWRSQRDTDAGPVVRILGAVQDITARKQAEEALLRSEQKLSLHVQHTPLAYIEWDADLQVVDWNPAAERIFGYSRREAMAHHAYKIIVPPKARPHVTQVWQSLLNQTGGTRSTNENVTKDGRTIVCEWYNTPLIHDGRVIGLASLVQDITDRVQAEEELREAKEAAEAANRAKSVFLANMSHELRTPLNAILGFSQLMARDPSLAADQQENLETISRSGEHLLTLINDVLEMSKIEAGRTTLYKQNFDLHSLLDDVEDMFHLRATEKGLALILDRAPDVPQYVRTDEGKLRQVLINLLSNAVKFTHEGNVTLELRYDGETRRLQFRVQDTGVGIAPEDLEKLFEPFVQTESGQASQAGTGLGLPISRQFVRLMGGDLAASSVLGWGSVFSFDVEVELAEEADIQAEPPARRVIGLEPDQAVYRLLVVEDQEASRRLLVKLLSDLAAPPSDPSTSSGRGLGRGFEVREAVNGQEAIEIWEQWEPHLIWMDMRMPVMDGHEATKRIKATTQGQATVIVALTASAFEEDRKIVLSEGCDDFVRKPFREEEILDRLTRHLGVRFVYEDAAAEGRAGKAAEDALTPAALAALPADWVSDLRRAAIQADADLVLGLVEQIREQDGSLADALASLVHSFRFDTIVALTQ